FVQMRWFKHGNSHFYLKTLKKTNTKSMFVFNLKQGLQTLFFNYTGGRGRTGTFLRTLDFECYQTLFKNNKH
ncbi:hypothetical protein ACFYEP_08065, partial [Streptococcus pyogenes]